MSVKNIFTDKQKADIVSAIESAELNSSAELRIHIENKCKIDVLDRAVAVFNKLEMEKTELRNGVLIYLAIGDKKVAILGDKGINEVVPEGFWDSVYLAMAELFKKGELPEGLCLACHLVGEKLKQYFPYQDDDVNELSNEISFEE
ncbi:MAG: TPM domain-containing protein [Rikenellaceae bacterium]